VFESAKRRRLPLPIRKYVAPIIGGSIALFSLLLTHQLVWRAFADLSSKLSAPALWLTAEGVEDERSVLVPTPQPSRPATTSNDTVKIQIVAPPDRGLVVSNNGFRVYASRFATGRSTADVRLRRGTNVIKATLSPDGEYQAESRASLEMVYHPTLPASPWFLAAWTERFDGAPNVSVLEVLGFGEPESIVHVDGDGSEIRTDRVGGFIHHLSTSRDSMMGLQVSNPTAGSPREPATMSVDPTKAGIQWSDSGRKMSRQLRLKIDAHQYRLTATAVIPAETTLGPAGLNAGEFLNDVFGFCLESENKPLDADVSSFECGRRGNDSSANVKYFIKNETLSFEFSHPMQSGVLKFVYEPDTALARSFLVFPDDSFRVEPSADVQVEAIDEGYRKDGSALVWEPGTEAERGGKSRLPWGDVLAIWKEESSSPVQSGGAASTTNANGQLRDRESGQAGERIIDRIRLLERTVPDTVRRLVQTLLRAIPFFWFLWILNRYPPDSRAHAATLRAVALTFLTLHLTILAFRAFETSFSLTLITFLHDISPNRTLGQIADVLGSAVYIFPFLALGVVLLVGPVFQAFRRESLRPAPKKKPRVWRAMAWLGFWIAVLTVPAATVWARIRIDTAKDFVGRLPMIGLMLAGSLVIAWFVLYWLLHGMFRISIGVWDAIRASWAMLLLPLVPPIGEVANSVSRQWIAIHAHVYPLLPEHAAPYMSAAIVAVLGAMLLLQTSELSLRLTQHVGVWRWFRSRNRLLLLLPLFVISIPVLSGNTQASIFTFTGFFYAIDWLLPYALLIGGILYVRIVNPSDSFELKTGELQLGALLFAWYVSGHDTNLLFVPVPFLIAWYVFSKWLLVGGAYASAVSSASVLTKLLDERHAQARLDGVEKGLDKKLSEGSLTLLEYKTKVNEAEEEAKSAKAALAAETGGAEPRALSNGPENGPSANARIAIIYGFVISVPFQISTLLGFMQQRPYTAFPLLEITYALVFSMTTWVLMAGVFGYFYHLIRGRNGFEKALCFSLAVVLPSLPLRLIAGESVFERAQLLDIVQVITFVLVLALVAFDLRTLTKRRHDWRDLLTLYGFASAAYGSTIAIAIASTLASKEVLLKVWGWIMARMSQ
jgi:hypothetical protein